MADPDYYEILGVSKDADATKIKTAYRDLALQFHPDRNQGDDEAAARMKALNEAYAVLSDPAKRNDYDALHQQYGPTGAYTHFRQTYSDEDIFSGTDIEKVFDELARTFGFRDFNEISKEFHGKSQKFEFKNQNVHVKGFFFSGSFNLGSALSKINFPGLLGRAAKTLLQAGSESALPMRGRDFHDILHIDPDLAQKGGPYAYYHRSRSKKLVVKIPPGIRHGQQIRLAGMGEKSQGENGDLYLKVHTKPSLINSIRKYLPF